MLEGGAERRVAVDPGRAACLHSAIKARGMKEMEALTHLGLWTEQWPTSRSI